MNNSTEMDLEEDPSLSPIIIVQIVIFALIFIIGIIGNTLVIYVVIRFSKMQTVTNMYIVNLAIADECFLLGVPILITTMIYRNFIFGAVTCKIYYISTSVNQFTSSILVLIISIDRYIAVCHSTSSHRWRTPLISKTLAALAWISSILLMTPIIQHADLVLQRDTDDKWSCQIAWAHVSNNSEQDSSLSSPDQIYTIYLCVAAFILPFSFIFVFYCLIIKKLLTVGPAKKSKGKEKANRKVTTLVMTVIAAYVVCGLPFWLSQLVIELGGKANSREFYLFAYCLSYANPAINPIIYSILSDNFRKSFTKAFACITIQEINASLQEDKSVFPAKKLSDIKLLTSNPNVSGYVEESDADSCALRRNSVQPNTISGSGVSTELLDGDKDLHSAETVVVEDTDLKTA